MPGKCCTRGASVSRNNVDHSVGNAGFLGEQCEVNCRQRSIFSRLDYYRVAGGKRRSHAPARQQNGKLLRETEQRIGLLKRLRGCFSVGRNPARIEHGLEQMLAQRIYGLAPGYEDLNDYDRLREDPLLAVLVEKSDPTGEDRIRARDRGKPLAGKSTLNRLEQGQPPRIAIRK
jgi:hypothetical protein